MSLRSALELVRALREDPALAARAAALGPLPTLEELVALGAAAGFPVTGEELRSAHRHDWAMRRARYAAPLSPAR